MSSSTSTAISSTPSSSACTIGDFTRFPSTDVYCAVGSISTLPANTSSVLSKCCKSAPVQQFSNKCGYYCLAYEQSVSDLQKCLQAEGVTGSSIFCSGNNTASATGRPATTVATSTRASSTITPTTSATKTGAANAVMAPPMISKAGLGVFGMIVLSMFTGALL